MEITDTPTATPVERHALVEMTRLLRQARGDHQALADVRRQIAAKLDELIRILRAAGVDVDALLDEVDEQLAEVPARHPARSHSLPCLARGRCAPGEPC